MTYLNLRSIRNPEDWPEAFGAVGDGVADDTAAISAWLDGLTRNRILSLDEGKTYRLTSQIVKTPGQIRAGIAGGGSDVSRFLVDNSTGGIAIRCNARNGQAQLHGFGVVAAGQGGIGFEWSQAEGGAAQSSSLILDDVSATSSDWGAAETDYFGTGLRFAGHFDPVLHSPRAVNSGIFAGTGPSSARYLGLNGIDLTGCYDAHVTSPRVQNYQRGVFSSYYIGNIVSAANLGGTTRCTIDNGPHPFSTGFRITISGASIAGYNGQFYVRNLGANIFELWQDEALGVPVSFLGSFTGASFIESAPEALTITTPNINGCLKGVVYQRPLPAEPTLWVQDGHINCVETNIEVNGAFMVYINGVNFYMQTRVAEWPSLTPRDVHLINSADVLLKDNIYHSVGNPDEQHPNRINIDVFDNGVYTRSGDVGRIESQIFKSIGASRAVRLNNNTRNWSIKNNTETGSYNQVYQTWAWADQGITISPTIVGRLEDLNAAPLGDLETTFGATATNKPGASDSAGLLRQTQWDATTRMQEAQLFFPAGNRDRIYTRSFLGTTWSAWVEK